MENTLVVNVHQTKKRAAAATVTTTKKKKKKPIKVVYISNPKKFNISATQFRSLVQELTGQDSDPAKFADPDYDDDVLGHHQRDDISGSKIDDDDDHHHHHNQVFSLDPTPSPESPPDLLAPPPAPSPPPPSLLFAQPFDEYDNAYHHQTFEDNLPGFVFSDFSHVDLLR